jgi:holo-[acyl-carrier protein] synthase
MIFGIGTDIVGIPRFDRFVSEQNEPLFNRLFTERERAYCAARARAGQHYALRFAAKEAFLKAMGTGLRDGISWLDMEVVNNDLGRPDLVVTGKAAALCASAGVGAIFLSLSHDAGCAVATVVLEKSGERQ